MKTRTHEYVEGQEAFKRFDAAMGALLSVSHDELKRREEAYKKQAALNPRKRGPKPKRKSVSPDPAV
jgi:hypothetical protein